MRLPRGNQLGVARVITSFGLSSRLSNRLVDAYLEAEDEQQQRYILAHPEHILWDQTDLPEDPYDSRLSCYGNDLMHSIMNLYHPLDTLLCLLGERCMGDLSETEREIISPFLREVSGSVAQLSEAIGPLQIHKQEAQDEG
jgi:hypothetical protein